MNKKEKFSLGNLLAELYGRDKTGRNTSSKEDLLEITISFRHILFKQLRAEVWEPPTYIPDIGRSFVF